MMDLEYVLRCRACEDYFTYKVDTPMDRTWFDAVEWCKEQYGDSAFSWRAPPTEKDTIFIPYFYKGTWANVTNHFFFHDENMAFEFRIRWA